MDSQNLRAWLDALLARVQEDTEYSSPSPKQLGLMNGLISSGIDKKNRLLVLRYILRLPMLQSSKHLTRHTVSTIIDAMMGDDGKLTSDAREALEYAERCARD